LPILCPLGTKVGSMCGSGCMAAERPGIGNGRARRPTPSSPRTGRESGVAVAGSRAEVVVLNDARCVELMQTFRANTPDYGQNTSLSNYLTGPKSHARSDVRSSLALDIHPIIGPLPRLPRNADNLPYVNLTV
jgi:hypothetical protein